MTACAASLQMGRYLCLALALVLQLARADEEGRAKLLLHKKLTPPEGPYAIGKPINITLQVWNQGPGNAYSVVVTDENWKQDKFRTIFQGNNFTLDFLNAGEQYMHECASRCATRCALPGAVHRRFPRLTPVLPCCSPAAGSR